MRATCVYPAWGTAGARTPAFQEHLSLSLKDCPLGNLFVKMYGDGYAQALEGLGRFAQRDGKDEISESGRTLVFDHGRPVEQATLLFHGLAASPRQFISVAQALHERGHNVFVPRLPRHGHRNRLSEALASMNAAQLEACAAEALAVARGLGERVNVAGFSLGGLLTAYLAQNEHLRRAVAVSPFLGIALVPSFFRMPIARWVLARPNRFLWWDPVLREKQMPEHGYPRFATHAVAQGLTLAHQVLEAAAHNPPATDDIVLVLNPRDSTVNKRAILRLAARWSSRKPEGVTLHRLSGLPPFLHDIIEPRRYPEVSRRVTREVVELIVR